MQLWPYSPPRQYKICDRSTELSQIAFDDSEIIETLALPDSNILVMITLSRVLIYNLKPMALVSVQERTMSSIHEFGYNKALRSSTRFHNIIKGLVSEREVKYLSQYAGKILFYVITEKDFLLTYQILKNSSQATIFKEYGLPVVDVATFDEDLNHEYEANIDDDTLMVFERHKSSKLIQNGYVVNKDKSFFQLFTNTNNEDDDGKDISIKRLELRLKIVLKFDFNIVDVLGFKKITDIDNGHYEENLIVLYPTGLQLLSLVDFKLENSSLIQIKNGIKMCVCGNNIFVISKDSNTNETLINILDISKLSTDVVKLKENDD